MLPEKWRARFEEIALDRVSGASTIAVNCASALAAFSKDARPPGLTALHQQLHEVTTQVLQGQPSMAPVLNVLNRGCLAVEAAQTLSQAQAALYEAASRFQAQTQAAVQKIPEHAYQVLAHTGTVATISYSSAVVGSLLYLLNEGQSIRVICLESRPNFEGRQLASLLSGRGAEVILATDAAAYQAMKEADIFLVGADSLNRQGFLNKTGTAALAASALALGKQGYVLSDTSKIWPARIDSPVITGHSPDEVWLGKPEAVRVWNDYFECVPWDAVAGVISEVGLQEAGEITRAAEEMDVSRFILGAYPSRR